MKCKFFIVLIVCSWKLSIQNVHHLKFPNITCIAKQTEKQLKFLSIFSVIVSVEEKQSNFTITGRENLMFLMKDLTS